MDEVESYDLHDEEPEDQYEELGNFGPNPLLESLKCMNCKVQDMKVNRLSSDRRNMVVQAVNFLVSCG